MKLILTQEVGGLGAAGDIVEVKDGYGRNFLIPRGFGIRWTKGGERTVDSIKAAAPAARSATSTTPRRSRPSSRPPPSAPVRAARAAGSSAPSPSATSPVRSPEVGSAQDAIDKRKIILGNPIKSLGSHQVTVKVHDDLEALVNLNVVPA